MTAAAAATPDRRGLVGALVALLVAALLAWVAAGSVWLRLPAGVAAADPTGADVVALVGAAGPISLAAIGGLVATHGVGRRLVGGLVALAGAALLASAVDVALRPADAAARWSGGPAPELAGARPTGWVWVGALSGALLVTVGVAAVARARRWPALSRRYERAPASGPERAAPTGGPATMRDTWEAQDRGDDPTSG